MKVFVYSISKVGESEPRNCVCVHYCYVGRERTAKRCFCTLLVQREGAECMKVFVYSISKVGGSEPRNSVCVNYSYVGRERTAKRCLCTVLVQWEGADCMTVFVYSIGTMGGNGLHEGCNSGEVTITLPPGQTVFQDSIPYRLG